MRSDKDKLLDILEAIEKIERYAVRGEAVFLSDELVQIWLVHHAEIIGEAARALSQELKASYPDEPWVEIAGMRNALAHRYFELSLDRIWETVESDLPRLKLAVQKMLAELPPDAR